jgi:hypothetical protein
MRGPQVDYDLVTRWHSSLGAHSHSVLRRDCEGFRQLGGDCWVDGVEEWEALGVDKQLWHDINDVPDLGYMPESDSDEVVEGGKRLLEHDERMAAWDEEQCGSWIVLR